MIFYNYPVMEGGGDWIPHNLSGFADISKISDPPLAISSQIIANIVLHKYFWHKI